MMNQTTRRQFCKDAAVMAIGLATLSAFPVFGSGRKVGTKPFVKWVGGKGQLLEQLDALLPANFAGREHLTYCEPFVGGGAMLFHVLNKYPNIEKAIVNDLNKDLITCYTVIKKKPEELICALGELQREYQSCGNGDDRKRLYYSKRDKYNSREQSDIETAALFIFLNKTGFNGLYRVNSKGEFNVPFNKAKNPLVCDADTIRNDSRQLQKVEILCGDFECIEKALPASSFIYFDPPYRPLTQTAAFTAYSKDGFDDEQQVRLANFCRRLAAAGHQWLLSNSDPHNVNPDDMFFEKLYDGFDIKRVYANRMVNSDASGRGKISELAIRNYTE